PHTFPTRRSSDLPNEIFLDQVGGAKIYVKLLLLNFAIRSESILELDGNGFPRLPIHQHIAEIIRQNWLDLLVGQPETDVLSDDAAHGVHDMAALRIMPEELSNHTHGITNYVGVRVRFRVTHRRADIRPSRRPALR